MVVMCASSEPGYGGTNDGSSIEIIMNPAKNWAQPPAPHESYFIYRGIKVPLVLTIYSSLRSGGVIKI